MKITKPHLFYFNSKRLLSWLCLLSCLFFGYAVKAKENETLKDIDKSSNSLSLGDPETFIEKLKLKNTAAKLNDILGSHTKSTQTPIKLNLISTQGEDISVVTDKFTMEQDGNLSLEGQVEGVENSEFIFQGTQDSLYGWVILRDQNLAYEYTTEYGELIVKQVKITDVHPICNFEQHNILNQSAGNKVAFPTAFTNSDHIGSYAGQHVGLLESKPGSNYVIFLDTSRIMSNGVPYDVSKEFIWTTWQIVAASFSMFDVNVTTNRTIYDYATPSKRGGATMYRETGRSSCHYAFGTSTFCTLYRENDAYGQGRIAVHELGHLFHLAHDGGQPGGEYFSGIPDFQWVPVMGNIWMGTGWSNALYQWSKGEYYGASNREDDFNILNGFIPTKSDDNTHTKALSIASNGSVSAQSNTGLIERNTDADSFSFTLGSAGGRVNLVIDRTEHIGGSMLDVQAYIKDSNGYTVAQSNKNVNRSASFNIDLSQGSYTLEIRGGAEGSPNHGFSNYSSVGYYAIEGQITGVGDETPSINNLANGAMLSGASQLFSWNTAGAEAFKISAGSTVGASDYYNQTNSTTNNAHTVTGLPVDGSAVFITLHYLNNGQWLQENYNFVAFKEGTTDELGLISPVDGETLTGSSQTFYWNSGQAEGFWFYAGSTQGAKDYYRNPNQLSGTSHTVTGLPTDGSTIHITFHYLMNGQWSQMYYIYTAATDGTSCTAAPDVPSKPSFTLDSSTGFTANWNTIAEATNYSVQLWINDSEWQTINTTQDSEYSFTNLAVGSTQYVRVDASNTCGASDFSQWTEVVLPSDSCNAAPIVPAGLNGTSQNINWQTVTGATRYDVQYWTGVWTDHGNTTNTSYNLNLSGTQYARVRAVNSCGSSDYSAYKTLY